MRRPHITSCAGLMSLLLLAVSFIGCDQVTIRERATSAITSEGLERSAQVVVLSEGLEAAWLKRLDGGLLIDAQASTPAIVTRADVRLGPVLQSIPVSRFDLLPKQELTTVVMVLDALQMIVPVRFGVGGSTVICRWQIGSSNVVSSVDLAVVEGSTGYNLEPIAVPLTQLTTLRVDAVGSCPVEIVEVSTGAPGELTRAEFEQGLSTYAETAISAAVEELLSTSSLELIGLVSGEIELAQPGRLANKRGVARISGGLSAPEPAPLNVSNGGLGLVLDYAASFEPAACAPLLELDVAEPAQVMAAPVTQADVRVVQADMALALGGGLIERILQTLTRAGFLCVGLERIGTATESLSLRDVEFDTLGISDGLFGDRVQYSVTPGSLPRVKLNTTLGTVDVSFEDLQIELYTALFGSPVMASRVTFPVTLSLKIVPDVAGMMLLRLDAVEIGEVELSTEWSAQAPSSDVLQDWTRRMVVLVFGESVRFPLPLRVDTNATLVEARVRQVDVVFFLSL